MSTHLAALQAGQDALVSRRHRLDHVVVGKRRQDDVGRLRDLAWTVEPAQALVDEPLRAVAMAFLPVDGVAVGEVAGDHVAAHVAEADEADGLHG
jgi:hypothetical protein